MGLLNLSRHHKMRKLIHWNSGTDVASLQFDVILKLYFSDHGALLDSFVFKNPILDFLKADLHSTTLSHVTSL